MINLVKRSDGKRLLEYFGNNFASPMWDEIGDSLRQELQPARTLLRPRHRVCGPWEPLNLTTFTDVVGELEKLTRGDLLAYEIDFSPPKSLSVAALAGPSVKEDLVRFHLQAVNETLAFLAPAIFERRMNKGQSRLDPAAAALIRFNHPWNRITEPQLHSHVLLHRVISSDSRALYG